MINTYQTSIAAPPLPPRLNRPQPVLIPEPYSSRGHSKVLIRFIVGVVLLHLFLSVGGFIFLYLNGYMRKNVSAEGKVAHLSSEKQETSYRAMARMVVDMTLPKEVAKRKDRSGFLEWNMKRSFFRNINYYHKNWLTILEPGDYYVYSRVTFSKVASSKDDSKSPLASLIKLRQSETAKEETTVMQAYCSLDTHGGPAQVSHLCTASQGQVIRLEKGNQLSVWVPDLLVVNYEEEATTFGMYQL